MTVETYTQTGHFDNPDMTPGVGFIYITPDQTVADGASDVVVAGVKIKVPFDEAGDWSVTLPTGIGYHGRPVLRSGYPPEADWTVPTGTVTLDWADITNAPLPPLTPDALTVAEQYAAAYTDYRTGPAVTTQTDLVSAITAATSAGGKILLPEAFTLESGVSVPQGVYLEGFGLKGSVVTAPAGVTAFTFTGTAATDTRNGGGITKVAIRLAGAGGIGVRCVDTRSLVIDVAVLGNNATGTSINAGSSGVKMEYGVHNVGCSWSKVTLYGEYLEAALDLDGDAFTPTWVTRNEFYGKAQTCTFGVRAVGANTNKFEFHPQNCGTAWSLVNSDTNDVYSVCESNTVDWDADSASVNNRVRGVVGNTGTIANEGTRTRWQTTAFTKLAPMRGPIEWDGNGANLVRQPVSGSGTAGTFHESWWTRDNTDALQQMLYLECGVATPRVRFPGPVKFDAAVDLSAATVTGLASTTRGARTSSSFLLTQSSTTLAPVTGLAVALAASTDYEIEALVWYDASTVSDIKFSWTAPTGAMLWSATGLQVGAASATDTTTYSRAGSSAGALAVGGAGVGTVVPVRISGTIAVQGTGGTLQLTAAQNTSEATQVTIYALSRLRALVLA